MKPLTNGLLLAIATANCLTNASIIRRDMTTCLNDLKVCDADLIQIRKDLDAYTGQSRETLVINKGIDKLNRDLSTTYTDCSATPASTVTAAQAQAIINYCNSPFEPDFKSFVIALKNKRATATSGGFKPTFQSQINQLKSNINNLTSAILSKTPSSQKAAASSCIAKISAEIQDAVVYYSE